MQANWSLVLNILLLIGVIIAIARMVKERRKHTPIAAASSFSGQGEKRSFDDVITVRKIDSEEITLKPVLLQTEKQSVSRPEARIKPAIGDKPASSSLPVMVLLMSKEHRPFMGYDLLQTLLSSGLRFGEGQLFHRHQQPNGQGPVLFSLASATASGVFDLQNMGAMSVRGLCLFMHTSGNPAIDAERFDIMLDTGRQLSEALDAYLLDDQHKPLSDNSVQRYHRQLGIDAHVLF